MKRSFLIFILLIGFIFLFPAKTLAQEYYFNDEFNQAFPANTLDSTKWIVYPNLIPSFNSIVVVGGYAYFSQGPNTNLFPYVISENGLPEGNFSAEIKFQYNYVTNWGNGIVLTDSAPDNGGYSTALLSLYAWQDNYNLNPNMRIGYQGDNVFTLPNNTNPHIFRVDRIGLKYYVYLDGVLRFTSPDTSKQAKYIWMGNPMFQPDPVPNWTRFKVDHVRVQSLQSEKTPLIFIPGVGGSEFKTKEDVVWSKDNGHGGTYSHTYPAGEKVWVNEDEAKALGNDDYFDILKLKTDGVTEESPLELNQTMFSGAYGGTINFFTSNGYTLDKNLFVFNYDWRKDLAQTKDQLDNWVEIVKSKTGSQKVDIVAHSMGGLVARNYINDPFKAQKVRKLITLGTPYLGVADSIKKLMYGGCFTKQGILSQISPYVCLGLSPSEVKDVSQNLPGVFELAPSQKYYAFYSGEDRNHLLPIIDQGDVDNNGVTGPLNYNQTKEFLTNLGHTTTLFTPSELFHSLDNDLDNTNGVDTTIIVGSGYSTLGQILENYKSDLFGNKTHYRDIKQINGDNTVPLFSAALNDSSKNLSLSGPAKVYYTNQKHENLPFAGPGMDLVKNILSDNIQIPNGVQTQPFSILKILGISVHSPVNIHVYNNQGNHTGPLPNGDFETNIPGSSYDTLDDAKFIWLPDEGQYHVEFEAINQGSFDFKIRKYNNDEITQTILYHDVPLTNSTKAKTEVDTQSSQLPVLQVDSDGNGSIDSQVDATSTLIGAGNYDQTPPKTNIKLAGITGNQEWYSSDVSIELNTEDEVNGSGISKVEYSLDNGQTIQIYSNPLTLTKEGISHLKFRAIDQAGNEENPQEVEIKVDKTPPVIQIDTPNSGSYLLNQKVTADYQCNDNISGLSSCTGSIPTGNILDTSSVGNKTITINSSDLAGNTTSNSVNYSIIYNIIPLFDQTKAFKSGSTIPIKLLLSDVDNNNFSSSSLVITAQNISLISNNAQGELMDSGNANPDNNFRFDSTLGNSGGYIFNLSTKGLTSGTYNLNFKASDDPINHLIQFQVK